jgi:hypothetical protein
MNLIKRFRYKSVGLGKIFLLLFLHAIPAYAEEKPANETDKPIIAVQIGENTASWDPAPVTPMNLHLRRKERIGVHIHNVEFRYAQQPTLATTPGKTDDQFSSPTSELEVSGFILPDMLYFQTVVEPRDSLGRGLGDSIAGKIDPTNAPTGIVRDAFGDFIISDPGLAIRFGQQRIPFGVETQTPGGLLPFINRAYLDYKVAHNAGPENTKFGNAEFMQERDIGIQIRGQFPGIEYALGTFNGSGINVNDTNNSKDWVGRLGFAPVPGLRIGVSTYYGIQTDLTKVDVVRNRVAGDFELNQNLVPRFRILGEYVEGQDGPFERNTWYVSGFYELFSQSSASSPGLLLSARYEEMHDSDDYYRTTAGLTYYFLNGVNSGTGYWQQVKFQLNYEIRSHGNSSPSTDPLAQNMLLGQVTVRY